MEKEFIPYEQALALKELGFDEPCFAWFVSEEYGLEFGKVIQSDLIKDGVVASTYSQTFRWFREKYSYQSFISPSNELTYLAYDFTLKGFDGYFKSKQFKTYEEAELECLKKLIEIIKNK
jgi:hypothetical protein